MIYTPECCPLDADGRAILNAAADALMALRPADIPEVIFVMWARTAIDDNTVCFDDTPSVEMGRARDYVTRGIKAWELSGMSRAAVLAARGY